MQLEGWDILLMIEKTKRNLRIYIILSMASVLLLIFGGIITLSYVSSEKSIDKGIERILSNDIYDRQIMDKKDLPLDDTSLDVIPPDDIPPNRLDDGFNISQPNRSFFSDRNGDMNKQPFFYFEVLDDEVVNFRAFDFTDVENSYSVFEDYFTTIIQEKKGRIRINNSYYAFDSVENESYTSYALMDITVTHYTFTNLLYIGGIILILSLIYISFLSYKLTNKTLSPLVLSIENQKRFSSDASHELRTPLASIRSNLDILTSYGDQLTTEEKNQWLENISKEIDRMTKLTSDLLLVSRDSPPNQEDYIHFEAVQLISSLEFIFNDKILPKNTQINFDYENTDFYAIENEIKQLIIIFIDNGLKYNDKEKKEINVSILDKDKHNQIIIRDNGIGIEEENYDKIFERFFRNDIARSNNQGFGLGLSIAHKIIEKYNGTVKIKSSFGEYTEFKINIPKH